MTGATLVTGATGLLGSRIVKELLSKGESVKALVRSPERTRTILPPECVLVEGDVTDKGSIERAIAGCRMVYHSAGLPEQWLPRQELFYKVNVGGTKNMVEVALMKGVEKFIYISTLDIFKAPAGTTYNEDMIDPLCQGSAYRRSKWEANRLVTEASKEGLPAVIICPGAIYGRSPREDFWFADAILNLKQENWPLVLPGGLPFVYCDDVAKGCLLAAEKPGNGGCYILNESWVSFQDMAGAILKELGIEEVPPVGPVWLMRLIAKAGAFKAVFTQRPPFLHEPVILYMQRRDHPDSSKARAELGWKPISFGEGVRRTLLEMGEIT